MRILTGVLVCGAVFIAFLAWCLCRSAGLAEEEMQKRLEDEKNE